MFWIHNLTNTNYSTFRQFRIMYLMKIVKPVFPYLKCTSIFITRNCSSTSDTQNDPIVDMENPFKKEKLECILCKLKISPNYKNVQLLSQFQSPYTGRIYGKHITGLCNHQQKNVEKEIIKAQNAGLMPTYLKDPKFFKDPKLFNPEKPIRPHRFE